MTSASPSARTLTVAAGPAPITVTTDSSEEAQLHSAIAARVRKFDGVGVAARPNVSPSEYFTLAPPSVAVTPLVSVRRETEMESGYVAWMVGKLTSLSPSAAAADAAAGHMPRANDAETTTGSNLREVRMGVIGRPFAAWCTFIRS